MVDYQDTCRFWSHKQNIDNQSNKIIFVDIKTGIIEGILYPALDPSIFEIKYPNTDIQGKVVGDSTGTTE